MLISDEFLLDSNFEVCNSKRDIQFLVFHHIEARTVKEAINLLDLHKVSSHYLIGDDGKIFQLVADNDIAFHAGYSYFRGVDGLNQSSIGVEMFSKNAYQQGFTSAQYNSLISLAQRLIVNYKIPLENVVGHSDIGYFPDDCDQKFIDQAGLLDRKDDPSHLFDWRLMAKNKVAICPAVENFDSKRFVLGDSSNEIVEIRRKIHQFGYKVNNFDEVFDIEMRNLCRVFNRRFNQDSYKVDPDCWWSNNNEILIKLCS